jgi:hypothetical protein
MILHKIEYTFNTCCEPRGICAYNSLKATYVYPFIYTSVSLYIPVTENLCIKFMISLEEWAKEEIN